MCWGKSGRWVRDCRLYGREWELDAIGAATTCLQAPKHLIAEAGRRCIWHRTPLAVLIKLTSDRPLLIWGTSMKRRHHNISVSKIILGSAFLFVGSGQALAGPAYTAPSTITVLNIREYSVDIYAPQADNPMNCSNIGWYRLKTDASNYDPILSFILTRYSAQAPIRFFVSTCDTSDGSSIVVAARYN
jgi:hypothetical protein